MFARQHIDPRSVFHVRRRLPGPEGEHARARRPPSRLGRWLGGPKATAEVADGTLFGRSQRADLITLRLTGNADVLNVDFDDNGTIDSLLPAPSTRSWSKPATQ
jgi:hypothetical protein